MGLEHISRWCLVLFYILKFPFTIELLNAEAPKIRIILQLKNILQVCKFYIKVTSSVPTLTDMLLPDRLSPSPSAF